MAVRGVRRAVAVPASIALIAVATLTPTGRSSASWAWGGEFAAADAVLNLGLFLPLGWALGGRAVRPLQAAGLGLLLSLAIESSQFLFVSGRTASPLDLAANTTGAWLGALLASGRIVSPAMPRRVRRHLLLMAIGAWLGQAILVAWAQQPHAPQTTTYFGQWEHVFPGTVALPFRMLEAVVSDRHITDGPLADTRTIRDGIENEGVRFRLRTEALTAVDGRAQLFGLVDGRGHFLASVDMKQCDILFDAYARAELLRLHSPRLRLSSACSPHRQATTIVGSQDGRRMLLAVERHQGAGKSVRLALSPLRGWALLLPIGMDEVGNQLVTAAWIMLTAAPVGLLAAWNRPRARWPGLLAGMTLLAGTQIAAWLLRSEGPGAALGAWLVASTWIGALAASRLPDALDARDAGAAAAIAQRSTE